MADQVCLRMEEGIEDTKKYVRFLLLDFGKVVNGIASAVLTSGILTMARNTCLTGGHDFFLVSILSYIYLSIIFSP